MRRTFAAAIYLGAMTTAWLTAKPATPQAANSQPVVAQGRGQGQGRGGRGGSARPRTRKAVLAWADTRNGIAQGKVMQFDGDAEVFVVLDEGTKLRVSRSRRQEVAQTLGAR